jgi:hypothetical protein
VSTDPGQPLGESVADGPLSAAIPNAAVRIHRDYLGRGPDKARTTIAGHIVVVLMEDTLTKASTLRMARVRRGCSGLVFSLTVAVQAAARRRYVCVGHQGCLCAPKVAGVPSHLLDALQAVVMATGRAGPHRRKPTCVKTQGSPSANRSTNGPLRAWAQSPSPSRPSRVPQPLRGATVIRVSPPLPSLAERQMLRG